MARIRENLEKSGLPEAVDEAVASCISDGILESYLKNRRAEVKDMFMTEYDEQQARKWFREEGLEQGREEGLEQGREDATLDSIKALSETMGWSFDKAMDALKIPKGERASYLERLD